MYYKIYPTIARYYKLQGAKKDLFFLINSFRENKQPFYASVQHIADVININRRNVYPLLKELLEEKLIEKIDNGINFTYKICDETSQMCDELSQSEMKHLKESEMIHLKKCDDTSQNGDETSQICDETSPNIKEYTNYNKVDIYKEESKLVIEYLNNKTNYNYKFVDKNIKLVSNRLKEYSKEELLAMIDYKCSEWLQDERFKKYLRPATLFNASKCADYIAQLQTTGLKNNIRSKLRGKI